MYSKSLSAARNKQSLVDLSSDDLALSRQHHIPAVVPTGFLKVQIFSLHFNYQQTTWKSTACSKLRALYRFQESPCTASSTKQSRYHTAATANLTSAGLNGEASFLNRPWKVKGWEGRDFYEDFKQGYWILHCLKQLLSHWWHVFP